MRLSVSTRPCVYSIAPSLPFSLLKLPHVDSLRPVRPTNLGHNGLRIDHVRANYILLDNVDMATTELA